MLHCPYNFFFSFTSIRTYLVLLLLLISFFSNAQLKNRVVYLDVTKEVISKQEFNKKIESDLYSGIKYVTDTLIIKKLKINYAFGKLKTSTKSQLFKLLSSRHQIDTTKTLVFHYMDTLKNKNEYPKSDYLVLLDSNNNVIKKIKGNRTSYIVTPSTRNVVKHKHLISYKTFLVSHKKCIKSYKKFIKKNVKILHFYSVNNGHPNQYKNHRWYKDYGNILKKLFYIEKRKFSLVVLKPNGEFFLYYTHGYMKNKLLFTEEGWRKYKQEFLTNQKQLNSIK